MSNQVINVETCDSIATRSDDVDLGAGVMFTSKDSPSEGFGACKWTGCSCTKFVVGGASGGKCKTCGHQDFNHGH